MLNIINTTILWNWDCDQGLKENQTGKYAKTDHVIETKANKCRGSRTAGNENRAVGRYIRETKYFSHITNQTFSKL